MGFCVFWACFLGLFAPLVAEDEALTPLFPPSGQGKETHKPLSQGQHLYSTPFLQKESPNASNMTILKIEGQGQDQGGIYKIANCNPEGEGFTVNFEDISVIQLLQFVSEISGINFIFQNEDLQFKVTIVSQEPASVTDLTSALVQILKIHGLSVVEQGNTVLVYAQKNLSKLSKIITDANVDESCKAAVVTRVFRLYNIDPPQIAAIIKPLLSIDASVDVLPETKHLIVSDLTSNVEKVAQLLNALDMPNTDFEVAEYQVKGGYPAGLVAYAKEILAPLMQNSPIQLIPQPTQNKIYVVSTPFLVSKALQILSSLDSPDITHAPPQLPSDMMENNQLYVYKLKFHNGSDIATALHAIGSKLQYAGVANLDLTNAIASSEYLAVNNSLIISGTPDAVQKVVALLNDLDQLPKQVYLEVLIIDTTLEDSLDFGVQWIALGDEQNKLAYASGLLGQTPLPNLDGTTTTNPGAAYVAGNGSPPPLTPNPARDIPLPNPGDMIGFTDLASATEAFGFGIIGNIIRHNGTSFLTLGALISALEEESLSKIVLNPKILVQDNQPASILVGQNIPYQTTSSVIQQTGSVTQNIQYEDIGVQLSITPTVSPEGIVSLQLDQSVMELVSAVGTLTPTTSKTTTTTRVLVPDGCFVVMSGHVDDEINIIKSGIPCLGSLPLIGPAFSRNIEQRSKRNLMIFLRPKVISDIEEALAITNQEGYDYNWQINPSSMQQCGSSLAPECEVFPAPPCSNP